jgi:tetratricopeptide (TPR) repeat protein
MLQTALDALARRDAAAALAAAQAAVAAEPDRAEAHHALGAALQLGGQLDEAAAAFDRAIELAPQQAGYHIARAALALGQRDLGTAETSLGNAIVQDPNALSAYVMSAHMALSRGQLEQAAEQLALARRVNPGHPLTLSVEGSLALARGEHEAAQRALHRAAELAPDEPLVLSSLALAYLATGNLSFAAQSLRRALQAQPDALNLRWLLVQTLRRLEHHNELATELEPLLAHDPVNWRALCLLGDARLRLGALDAAQDAYRRALASPRAPLQAADAVASVLTSVGQVELARQLLDEQLETRPDDDSAWQRRLALVEAEPQAVSAFVERWLQAIPDSPLARQARAGLLEQLGELDAAEAAADEALARQPLLPGAGLVKLRAGLRKAPESALAVADALLASPLDPFAQRVFKTLRGHALDRLGRHREAADEWLACVDLGEPAAELPAPRPPVIGATDADGIEPRLLWGLPGSRIGAVVALLRSLPELHVLDDRFSPGPRPDGLWPPREDGSLSDSRQWKGMLERRGLAAEQVIDWLPQWDEAIASALPQARLLVVLDDPRDLLLNWLAFGAPQTSAPAPAAAAAWLAQVLEPLAQRLEASDLRVARIGGQTLAEEPGAAAERCQAFFALPACPQVDALAAAERSLGDVPVAFPAGHWRHYAEPLAEAFARLAPIATRLGYPAN